MVGCPAIGSVTTLAAGVLYLSLLLTCWAAPKGSGSSSFQILRPKVAYWKYSEGCFGRWEHDSSGDGLNQQSCHTHKPSEACQAAKSGCRTSFWGVSLGVFLRWNHTCCKYDLILLYVSRTRTGIVGCTTHQLC